MIKFFRRIRNRLVQQSKVSKYLLYALGEIVLVVIGILIALEINNRNEAAKNRTKERQYLENIKIDLEANNSQIEEYIQTRNIAIQSSATIVDHFNGKPIIDTAKFTLDAVNIYTWRKFFMIDNTYQELVNTGNLALISDPQIKDALMNLQTLYRAMKYEEEHFRFDAEVLLYVPSYETTDLDIVTRSYANTISNGQMGERVKFPENFYDKMLADIRQKNGFVMANYEFSLINGQFTEMKVLSDSIISLINRDLKRD